MKAKFPQTLEAAKRAEGAQWAIGDALLKEAEDKVVGTRGLQEVADDLAQYGIDFSAKYLGELRRTAEAFPRNRRHDLPWKVHAEAGSPDNLDVIVRAARKEGEKVTIWYVGDALRRIRAEARVEREKLIVAAKREKEKAEAEEHAAREREQKAQDREEKERAASERRRASDRKAKANEKIKAAKVAPKKRDVPPPAEDDVSLLVAKAFLIKNANEASRLAAKAKAKLGRNVSDLTPTSIAYLTDAAMSAANAWADLAAFIRSQTVQKRGHLSAVVNE